MRPVVLPRSAISRANIVLDMWWLAVSLWLICIVEVSVRRRCASTVAHAPRQRYGIMDPAKPWFNVFAIRTPCPSAKRFHVNLHPVFEVVSAYGTVGLSLGLPTVSRALLHARPADARRRRTTRSQACSTSSRSSSSAPSCSAGATAGCPSRSTAR